MPATLQVESGGFHAVVAGLAVALVAVARRVVALAILALAAAAPLGAQTLLLSDIHFDPLADPAIVCRLAAAPVEGWTAILESSKNTPWPTYSSDTTYPLLVSSLTAAASKKFDRVIVSGDYLRHNFDKVFPDAVAKCAPKPDYAAFAIKTVLYVSRRVAAAFPGKPVISAFGNNDSTCGDYAIGPGDPMIPGVVKEWRAGSPFAIGGYYAVPAGQQEFVVLNDILWSAKFSGHCGSPPSDPGAGELAWLSWTLFRLQAEKKTAVLIMHIPPGMDAYLSSRAACPSPAVPMWNPAYADQFVALLQKYPGVVTEMIAGHTHADDFRVVAGIPLHITPSITPGFGNNPGFIVATGTDYTVTYLTNLGKGKPVWQSEYTFSTAYGFPYNAAGVTKLAAGVATDPNVRSGFEGFYAVSTPQPPPVNDKNWKFYSCAQTEMTAQGFNRCACGTP